MAGPLVVVAPVKCRTYKVKRASKDAACLPESEVFSSRTLTPRAFGIL